jgi:hypothetical protein
MMSRIEVISSAERRHQQQEVEQRTLLVRG